MSASRIKKILNPQYKWKLIATIRLSIRCTKVVHKCHILLIVTSKMMLDFADLEAIDKAFLDARESSKLNPDSMEKLKK